MSQPARRLDRVLADSTLAAALAARIAAGREAAKVIAPICAEIAPQFDPFRPGNCDLRDRELRIWLRSSAQSTKLRQATPRLLAALRDHGLQVSEIKLRVQPGKVRESSCIDAPNKARLASKDGYPQKGNSALANPLAFSRKLALTLPDGALRRAVATLGQAIDRRLARMRESDQPLDEQD